MSLEDKAIDIKGKKYILVKDRIIEFNKKYKNGSITNQLKIELHGDTPTYIVKSTVTPDVESPQRKYTGYASETLGQGHINEKAALENAETSAVGRALAMMGIGVLDSVASVDEMHKAMNQPVMTKQGDVEPSWRSDKASEKQEATIIKMIMRQSPDMSQPDAVQTALDLAGIKKMDELTKGQASDLIDELNDTMQEQITKHQEG